MQYNIKPTNFDGNFKTELKWGNIIFHVSAYSWRLGSAYAQNCPRAYGYSAICNLGTGEYGDTEQLAVGMIKSKEQIIPAIKEKMQLTLSKNETKIVKLKEEIDRLKIENKMISKALKNSTNDI